MFQFEHITAESQDQFSGTRWVHHDGSSCASPRDERQIAGIATKEAVLRVDHLDCYPPVNINDHVSSVRSGFRSASNPALGISTLRPRRNDGNSFLAMAPYTLALETHSKTAASWHV
jgi:hypothetical protein